MAKGVAKAPKLWTISDTALRCWIRQFVRNLAQVRIFEEEVKRRVNYLERLSRFVVIDYWWRDGFIALEGSQRVKQVAHVGSPYVFSPVMKLSDLFLKHGAAHPVCQPVI